eukprot:1280755-Heterocapsa_arctica.AAC.1
MAGFLEHNSVELRNDISASGTKAYNFMIGLMADDIEATPGYNRRAERKPDELLETQQFRDAIAGRLTQFFGCPNPTAEQMYTHRGQLAAE